MLVVGAGVWVVLGGDEGCGEHGVFEAVVAASGFAGHGAASGLPVDGGEPGVGGEAAAVGESVGVADLSEGSGSGSRAEPAQAGEDFSQRVVHERCFDVGGEVVGGGRRSGRGRWRVR